MAAVEDLDATTVHAQQSGARCDPDGGVAARQRRRRDVVDLGGRQVATGAGPAAFALIGEANETQAEDRQPQFLVTGALGREHELDLRRVDVVEVPAAPVARACIAIPQAGTARADPLPRAAAELARLRRGEQRAVRQRRIARIRLPAAVAADQQAAVPGQRIQRARTGLVDGFGEAADLLRRQPGREVLDMPVRAVVAGEAGAAESGPERAVCIQVQVIGRMRHRRIRALFPAASVVAEDAGRRRGPREAVAVGGDGDHDRIRQAIAREEIGERRRAEVGEVERMRRGGGLRARGDDLAAGGEGRRGQNGRAQQ